jgi:hypothetical protein
MNVPIVQFYAPGFRRCIYGPEIHTWPTARDTNGPQRGYGWALREAWRGVAGRGPMIVLEQDVAFDPWVMAEIENAVATYPDAVVAAPYILWPAHTRRPPPVWSNLVGDVFGTLRRIDATEHPPERPSTFGLGLTYLPAKLLQATEQKLPSWYYPHLDMRLSMEATRAGIAIIGTQLPAIHLHWWEQGDMPHTS